MRKIGTVDGREIYEHEDEKFIRIDGTMKELDDDWNDDLAEMSKEHIEFYLEKLINTIHYSTEMIDVLCDYEKLSSLQCMAEDLRTLVDIYNSTVERYVELDLDEEEDADDIIDSADDMVTHVVDLLKRRLNVTCEMMDIEEDKLADSEDECQCRQCKQ